MRRTSPAPIGLPANGPATGRRLVGTLVALAALLVALCLAPAARAATTTFTPTDDTYVASDKPTTNYGKTTSAYTDGSPYKHVLLKFNVTGLTGAVQTAKLRIYCKSDPSVAGGEFHQVTDTSWSEGVVTWKTAPPMSPTIIGTLGAVKTGTWYEVDVTGTVTGSGVVSYEIVSSNADGANYATREAGSATAPQLVITTAEIGRASCRERV